MISLRVFDVKSSIDAYRLTTVRVIEMFASYLPSSARHYDQLIG